MQRLDGGGAATPIPGRYRLALAVVVDALYR